MFKLLPNTISDDVLQAMTAAYEDATGENAMAVAVDVLRQHLAEPNSDGGERGHIMSPHAHLDGYYFVRWSDGSITLDWQGTFYVSRVS